MQLQEILFPVLVVNTDTISAELSLPRLFIRKTKIIHRDYPFIDVANPFHCISFAFILGAFGKPYQHLFEVMIFFTKR